MFRAPMRSSSGELIVSMRHLLYVTLFRWPSGVQVWMELMDFHPNLHTRRSPTYSDIYQMYWYNWFSWWWAHGCWKHVENWNKHTRKRIMHQVGYLQELGYASVNFLRLKVSIKLMWTPQWNAEFQRRQEILVERLYISVFLGSTFR